jgi:D-sedoheptulose 7-phosphate isomerase
MSLQLRDIIQASIDVKQRLLADEALLAAFGRAVDIVTEGFLAGRSVWFCGNGGSAADAQHLAAELSGRFRLDRTALPAEALHVNTSYLTAVANDYGYDAVYARLVEGYCRPGDLLVGLSTSGNSPNIVKAFASARGRGITTIGLTGAGGGRMAPLSDILLNVPSTDTPRIQEAHILLGHMLCELVERRLFIDT